MSGALDVNTTADIGDTLTLSKVTGNGLSVVSDAAVGGNLGVTNAATLGSLNVNGASVFAGAVSLNGGVTIDSDKFSVGDNTGNTVVGGTLNVSGDSIFLVK